MVYHSGFYNSVETIIDKDLAISYWNSGERPHDIKNKLEVLKLVFADTLLVDISGQRWKQTNYANKPIRVSMGNFPRAYGLGKKTH